MARPTKYQKKFVKDADKYLAEHKDETEKKLKVKLPTIEGFAQYIGVHKSTLYEWEVEYDEFSDALEKIRAEQQQRLINMGLSGDYNSTIAKLILSSNHGMREKSDVTSDDKGISPLMVKIIDEGNADTNGVQKTS